MKKLILFICAVTLAVSAFAQSSDTADVSFTLTENGFVYNNGAYQIKYYPGKSRHDLFVLYQKNIDHAYTSQNKLINQVDDSLLSVHAVAKLGLLKFVTRQFYNVSYNLSFEFYDGKVKINAPVLNSIKKDDGTRLVLNTDEKGANNVVVFNKDGSVQYKQPKQNLETYFNNLLSTQIAFSGATPPPSNEPVVDQLKKWKALLDNGAITQEEYDIQKKKLLGE